MVVVVTPDGRNLILQQTQGQPTPPLNASSSLAKLDPCRKSHISLKLMTHLRILKKRFFLSLTKTVNSWDKSTCFKSLLSKNRISISRFCHHQKFLGMLSSLFEHVLCTRWTNVLCRTMLDLCRVMQRPKLLLSAL